MNVYEAEARDWLLEAPSTRVDAFFELLPARCDMLRNLRLTQSNE